MYTARKAIRAWSDGTLTEKVKRRAVSQIRAPMAVLLGHRRLNADDHLLDVAAGFADHRFVGHATQITENTARRIQNAYKKAKADESSAAEPFQIKGLWAEWRDINHRELMNALVNGAPPFLASFLNNLERQPSANGTGAGYNELLRHRSMLGDAYIRSVWCGYRDDALTAYGVSPEEVSHPLIGNPAGIWHNGSAVQAETWRHAGFAAYLREHANPNSVILEIGGGFGSQAYQFLRLMPCTRRYLDFDIPEVSAVAAAFLITAFPEKQVCLYGEGQVSSSAGDYDIGIFPHFAIDQIEAQSVHLIFNANSFSEMDGASARHYLASIERIGNGLFFHSNHEQRLTFRTPDGSNSTNLVASEMRPDKSKWDLAFSRLRSYRKPEDLGFVSTDYLYARQT